MKDKTIDTILIAVMVAIAVLWFWLGLGYGEENNDVYLGSILLEEKKNYTPEQKKALTELLITLHKQADPDCKLGIIVSRTDEKYAHYFGLCLERRPPPKGVEI